jgi:hypothetical protein
MVVMHAKKNDLSTKMIADDLDRINEIVLPLGAFRQCLKVIGIDMNP